MYKIFFASLDWLSNMFDILMNVQIVILSFYVLQHKIHQNIKEQTYLIQKPCYIKTNRSRTHHTFEPQFKTYIYITFCTSQLTYANTEQLLQHRYCHTCF